MWGPAPAGVAAGCALINPRRLPTRRPPAHPGRRRRRRATGGWPGLLARAPSWRGMDNLSHAAQLVQAGYTVRNWFGLAGAEMGGRGPGIRLALSPGGGSECTTAQSAVCAGVVRTGPAG